MLGHSECGTQRVPFPRRNCSHVHTHHVPMLGENKDNKRADSKRSNRSGGSGSSGNKLPAKAYVLGESGRFVRIYVVPGTWTAAEKDPESEVSVTADLAQIEEKFVPKPDADDPDREQARVTKLKNGRIMDLLLREGRRVFQLGGDNKMRIENGTTMLMLVDRPAVLVR